MLLALILSVVIGIALGLLGGGGSILTVPMLTSALAMDAKPAIATSLFIVAVTSVAGVIPHALAGHVDFRKGATFGASGMVGAYLGGRVSAFIPGSLLLTGFAVMMFATGLAMLRPRRELASGSLPRSKLGQVLVHGLVVGLVTGLVGAGGGFLIVPALVLLGGMSMKEAVGTSLFVISMKSTAGLLGYIGHVQIDLSLALWLSGAAVLGSVFGGLMVKKVPQRALRIGFAWFVVVAAAVVAAREIPDSVRALGVYQAAFVERWPFWFGGLAIASVVLLLLFVDNNLLGVSTGCSELCALPKSSEARRSWRLRFLLGIVIGGALAAVMAGSSPTLTMGSFDAIFGGTVWLKGLVLLVGGVMIGLGARWAGGCTSGHGIVGTAQGARSSLLATVLFMVAGFATTNVIGLFAGK